MDIDVYENGGLMEGDFTINDLTLTGPLLLRETLSQSNEASHKQYVDSKVNNLDAGNLNTGTIPTGRLPGFNGDLTSPAGSNTLTLNNTSVSASTYTKIVVDDKGRATSGGLLSEEDIPSLSWSKLSPTPSSLSGYGITDGVPTGNGVVNGVLTLFQDPASGNEAATKHYADNTLGSASGSSGVIVGDMVNYPLTTTPAGYLRANGADLDKTTYSDLYDVIGDAFTPNRTMTTNNGQRVGSGKPWKQQWDINNTSGNMGSWTTETNTLPEALGSSQAVITNSRVYLLGGNNSNGKTDSVYSASINSDGTIGTWATESITLPETLRDSQAVVTSSRVYLLGGYNGNNIINDIYSAPINVDGTIGTWSSATNTLPGVLYVSQAVITSSRVYLLGGYGGNGKTDSIYSAPINSDGTIGAWVTESNTLPEVLRSSQAIVTSSRVYLLGGVNDIDATNKIYSAPINSDGTLGTWVIETNALPETLYVSQAVVTNSRVYLLGGYGGNGKTDSIYSAPINSDGTLGTWVTEPMSLSEGLREAQTVVTSSRVYLLGGENSNGRTNKIYSAPFTGGLNDYMPIITAPIGSTSITDAYPDDKFRLPDFTSLEGRGKYFYIKYQ